jgi:diguanylate cyclase (GGDEF)-like protein/PAS domain S-box-containing protein
MPPYPHQPRSLKTRISLFTLLIFSVSLWSLTFYASQMLRQDMQRQLSDQQFSVVHFLAGAIDAHLNERLRALELVAGGITPQMLNQSEALNQRLESLPVLQTVFSGGVLITDAQGTAVAEAPRSVGRVGLNFMDRKAVALALSQGHAVIGTAVMDKRLGVPVIGMAAPIRDTQGRNVGTLAGVMALEHASFLDQLTQSAYGKTGSYFLVDRQERLIVAATKKDRVLQPLSARGQMPAIDRFVDGFEGSQVYINPNGVEVLNSVKRLKLVDWGISASISTAEAFAPIWAMQQRMVLAASVLTVLAAALMWWLLRHEFSPLSDTARRLSGMSLAEELPQPLPIVRQDEIGILIGQFNHLLGRVAQQRASIEQQLQLFSAFIDALPNPVFVKNQQTVFTACNRAYEQAFGIERTQFIGKTVLELDYLPLEAREAFQAADLALLAQGGQTYEEIDITFADGVLRTALYQRCTFELGTERGMLGLIVDISERKRRDDYQRFYSYILEILASGAPIEDILEAIVCGIEALHPGKLCSIVLLDEANQQVVRCIAPSLPSTYNQALLGLPTGLGVGSCGTAAFTGEPVVVEDIATHPYWADFKDLAAQAQLGACWSQPIRSSNNRILGVFGVYHRQPYRPTEADMALIEQTAQLASISIEKSRAEEQIRHLAYCDSLTQLPNRRLLEERLALALANSRRTGLHGAVMLLDLDNFKPLNDTHGHAVGDLLLLEVARRLSASVREVDTVARLGGDEFVVVIGDLDTQAEQALPQAMVVAEKIRAALSQPYRLQVAAQAGSPARVVEHRCSCSVGMTLFAGRDAPRQTELLRQADDAMYRAKQSGRNTIHL